MFPSDNNSDHENPLELLKKPSFMIHQNPSPSIFSNFPSPFFDEHESIMPFDHPVPTAKPIDNNNKTETAAKREKPDDDQPPPPLSKRRNLGKRTGKKDRHSKIRTAQGIRDRRMRLSLQIARKFFDLQDMLGYDKASSTIEWLFSKSKKARKELMTTTTTKEGINNFSGGSESFVSDQCDGGVEVSSTSIKGLGQITKKKLPRKTARKPNRNARESREKARARARWRTREKMMIKLGFETNNPSGYWASNNNNNNNLCSPNYNQRLGFCNGQEYTTTLLAQDVGTIDNFLGNSSLSSSTSNFSPINSDNNYQCCIDPSINLMGFLGNWDLLSNDQLSSGNNIVNPTSFYSPILTLFHQ